MTKAGNQPSRNRGYNAKQLIPFAFLPFYCFVHGVRPLIYASSLKISIWTAPVTSALLSPT
jgi:hypothetical protein